MVALSSVIAAVVTAAGIVSAVAAAVSSVLGIISVSLDIVLKAQAIRQAEKMK